LISRYYNTVRVRVYFCIGLDIPGFWKQIIRITIPVLFCLEIGAAVNGWDPRKRKGTVCGESAGLYGILWDCDLQTGYE